MSEGMIEDIDKYMLEEFKEAGFEDTTENRLAFLQGLQAAWDELPAENGEDLFAKALYKVALSTYILSLMRQVREERRRN